jgi:RND family efflux transporter MFP subunit
MLLRLAICLAILAAGVLGMLLLSSQKKAPAKADSKERPLRVEAWQVAPLDEQVKLTGFGEVKALNRVSIASEVTGKVMAIHPRLEVGEVIAKGELLFAVDPVNYQAAFHEAKAAVRQRREEIKRLQKQQAIDTRRFATLQRSRDLARAEFERLKALFEQDEVGTQSGVEKAEQAYNQAKDAVDLMSRTLDLYPIRVQEARSLLDAAQARLELAKANLERTRVEAPFSGRVTAANVERGEYIASGRELLRLADDSLLEIRVPLDGKEARRWLRFEREDEAAEAGWFSGLTQTPCRIRWSEARDDHFWVGRLHRVVEYDPKTRTLTVAVRMRPGDPSAREGKTQPLVEGMFCSVEIPGKDLNGVFRLPREAVSFENTVYAVRNNRLQTLEVEVVRTQGRFAYIGSGLEPGETVITTRLIDPLENALVEITDLRTLGQGT